MAVDFPTSPVEGQLYAAEGSVWKYTAGRWAVTSNDTALHTIVASGLPAAGWQVWGDTLVCWGRSPGASGLRTVVFPRTFKVVPSITLSTDSAVAGEVNTLTSQRIGMVDSGSRTITGFKCWTSQPNTGAASAVALDWIAIGEAQDADKQPKTTTVGVGGDGGGGGGGLDQATADARYLQLTGGKLTGNLIINAASDPGVTFGNAAGVNYSKIAGGTNAIYAWSTDAAGAPLGSPLQFRFGATGCYEISIPVAAAPNPRSVMTRDASDARYPQLDQPNVLTGGGSITGPATGATTFGFTGGGGLAMQGGNLAISATNSATGYLIYGGSGGPATADMPMVILSRQMGDARYTLKAVSDDLVATIAALTARVAELEGAR